MALGLIGACMWPDLKNLWDQHSACAQLFSRSEIEALLGHEVDSPSAHTFDCDYFADCDATWGEPAQFSVSFAAGFGTSDASYGYEGRVSNLDVEDVNATVESAPDLGDGGLVSIANVPGGNQEITAMVRRPNGGAIEVSATATGKVTPEFRRAFLGSFTAHLSAADAFFHK